MQEDDASLDDDVLQPRLPFDDDEVQPWMHHSELKDISLASDDSPCLREMSDAAVDDGVVGEVHVDSDGVVGSVVGGADVAVVGVDDLLPKNAVHFLDCQLACHLLTSCNRRYQSKTPSEDDVHDDKDPWIR